MDTYSILFGNEILNQTEDNYCAINNTIPVANNLTSLRQKIAELECQINKIDTGVHTMSTSLIFVEDFKTLKIGDKIRIITSAELINISRRRYTGGWTDSIERVVKDQIFTVNKNVLSAFQNGKSRIYLHEFDNYYQLDASDWWISTKDFVFVSATEQKPKTKNAYQLLKLNLETQQAENILLSFDENKVKNAKVEYEKENKDEKIIFQIITFVLKNKEN